MWRTITSCLLLAVITSAAAVERKPLRPVTNAESVLAIYCDSVGEAGDAEPAIIFAAWPDGQIVWSDDRLHGGPPYREAQIKPNKVISLLARLEKDGLFADEKLKHARFGPDSSFTALLIKRGDEQIEMRSWHELFEASGKLIATNHGVAALEGRRRLDVLRKEPADYLYFRFVWSETRGRLVDLVPNDGKPSNGKLVRDGNAIAWQP